MGQPPTTRGLRLVLTELANLRNAFRWAADQSDLDTAAKIATQAGFLGALVEKYEPIAWAEELIDPARAVDHPRLVSLYAIASLCYQFGRVDDSLRYSNAGQLAMQRSPDELPSSLEQLWLGAVDSAIGQLESNVAFHRDVLARGYNPHELGRACLVIALTNAGRPQEALSIATGLIDAAEATRNPFAASFALLAYGMACSTEDPLRALDAMQRSLEIARQSGNRTNESYLAMTLAMTMNRIEGESADPLMALDNISMAIRNLYDAGNITQLRSALGLLVTFLDRHGRPDPAAILAGFACVSPTSAPTVPELGTAITHLRDVLGQQNYEPLARRGEAMTMAVAVAFAYDQIDQARAERAPSQSRCPAASAVADPSGWHSDWLRAIKPRSIIADHPWAVLTLTSRAPRGDWTEVEGRRGWRLGWRIISVPNQVRNVAHPRPDEVVGVADVPIPIQWVGNMITGRRHGLLPWAPVMWWAPIAIVCGDRCGI